MKFKNIRSSLLEVFNHEAWHANKSEMFYFKLSYSSKLIYSFAIGIIHVLFQCSFFPLHANNSVNTCIIRGNKTLIYTLKHPQKAYIDQLERQKI